MVDGLHSGIRGGAFLLVLQHLPGCATAGACVGRALRCAGGKHHHVGSAWVANHTRYFTACHAPGDCDATAQAFVSRRRLALDESQVAALVGCARRRTGFWSTMNAASPSRPEGKWEAAARERNCCCDVWDNNPAVSSIEIPKLVPCLGVWTPRPLTFKGALWKSPKLE